MNAWRFYETFNIACTFYKNLMQHDCRREFFCSKNQFNISFGSFFKFFCCIEEFLCMSIDTNIYIGADYTSQTLIDFDWYNPQPYQHTTRIIKKGLTHFLLHHIKNGTRTKHKYMITVLWIHWRNELARAFLRLGQTEKTTPPHTKKCVYTTKLLAYHVYKN